MVCDDGGERTTNTDIVVLATVFLLPFGGYLVPTGVFSISPPNLFLLLSLLLLSYRALIRNQVTIASRAVTIVFLLTGVFTLLSVFAILTNGSPRQAITFFGYLLLTIVLGLYVKSSSDLVAVLYCGYLSALLIAFLTTISVLFQIPIGAESVDPRTVAGFTLPTRTLGVKLSYGSFGMYLLWSVPYFLFRGLYDRNWGFLLGVSFIVITAVLTQSRSTWVATAVAIIISLTCYFLFRRQQTTRPFFRKISTATVGSIITGIIVIAPAGLAYLIKINEGTYSSRLVQYQNTLRLLSEYPIFGAGYGNLGPVFVKYGDPHNAFLYLGATGGLLPLILTVFSFCLVVRWLLQSAVNQSTEHERILAVSLIAGLAAVLVEANLQPGFGKAPWLIVSLGASMNVIRS